MASARIPLTAYGPSTLLRPVPLPRSRTDRRPVNAQRTTFNGKVDLGTAASHLVTATGERCFRRPARTDQFETDEHVSVRSRGAWTDREKENVPGTSIGATRHHRFARPIDAQAVARRLRHATRQPRDSYTGAATRPALLTAPARRPDTNNRGRKHEGTADPRSSTPHARIMPDPASSRRVPIGSYALRAAASGRLLKRRTMRLRIRSGGRSESSVKSLVRRKNCVRMTCASSRASGAPTQR
jgi:hypothetical protein